MRHIYLFLVMGIGLIAQAQETPSSSKQAEIPQGQPSFSIQQEVGIAASSLIRSLFTDNSPAAPYILTYKARLDRFAIRTGLGGNYTRQLNITPDLEVNGRSLFYEVRARLGLEYQTVLSKRWRVSLGADGILRWNQGNGSQETANGQRINASQVRLGGGGPVVGCWLTLNKRLSLYAESALYFTMGTNRQTRIIENGLDRQEISTHTQISQVSFTNPAILYMVYHF